MNNLGTIKLEIKTGVSTWTDVSGPTRNINIDREAGDVGLLNARISDATLDPTTTATLKPGQELRVSALNGTVWTRLFTGVVQSLSVYYEDKTSNKPTIEISAADRVADMSAISQSRLMETIEGLREILNVVPYNINGSTASGTGTVAATNDNQTLWQSVLTTRDSFLAYAWVDASNIVKVFDDAHLPTSAVGTIGPSVYSGIESDFNTDEIINSVMVEFLRYSTTTDEAVVVPYGPYEDSSSIAQWGMRRATYRISLPTESTSAISAYANSVLSRMSGGGIRTRSVTVPIRSAAEVANGVYDLIDKVSVVGRDGTTTTTTRIGGISHSITATSWQVTYEFTNGIGAPSSGADTTTSLIPDGSVGSTQLSSGVLSSINNALIAADAAQTFASTRNRVYRQTTMPTGGTYTTGDVWYDTDDGNKMYTYNGSSWIELTSAWLKTNPSSSFPGVITSPYGLVAYDSSGSSTLVIDGSSGSVTMKGSLISGSDIQGATITTSSPGVIQTEATSNRGIKISSTGLSAYDSSGNPTFVITASTGSVVMKGSLQAGSSVTVGSTSSYLTQLNTSGEIVFGYTGVNTGKIRATSSGIGIGNVAGTETWLAMDPSAATLGKMTYMPSGAVISSSLTSNGNLLVDQIRPNTSGTINLGTTSDAVTAYGWVKTGVESVNITALNTTITKNVSFPSSYSSNAAVPTVMLTLRGATSNDMFKLSTSNITRTGFTINIVKASGSLNTVDVAWLAVGS